MSRIDPNISLRVNPPQQQSDPLENYGKMLNLKNAMTQGRINEQTLTRNDQVIKEGDQTAAESERRAKAEQSMREAIKANMTTGEDGSFSINHDKVEAALVREGFGDTALNYNKSRMEIENAAFDHMIKGLDAQAKRAKQLGAMAQAVLNAPEELRPAVYGFTLKQAVSAGLVDAKTLQDQGIPLQYDEKTAPILQQLSDMAVENPFEQYSKRMAEARAAKTAKQATEKHDMEMPGAKAEALKKQVNIESQLLSAAKNQNDWTSALNQIPEDRRKSYPAEFSEEARKAAEGMGVEPIQRLTLEETHRRNLALEQQARKTGVEETHEIGKNIADAVMEGLQPPVLTGLYRYSAIVRSELAKAGYDLTTATRDWQAITRHLATLNGPQQERLRQAITFTAETLPQIEELFGQWKILAGQSGYKVLNRATLKLMSNLPGKAGSVATNLEALVSDLTSELGTVYKGGNSSTDESLELAAKNLSADWNSLTFEDAMKRLKQSLRIRYNSIMNSTPVGVSAESKFAEGGRDGIITEDMIERVLNTPANAGATREEVIEALEAEGYRR